MEKKVKKAKDYKPFYFSGIAVILVWIISIIFISYIFSNEEGGLFGDSFGAINSLFSGLAFAGIITSIALQGNDLKLQREDLDLTRQELKKSTKAQNATQLALNEQVKLITKQSLLSAYQSDYLATLEIINIDGRKPEYVKRNNEVKKKINRILYDLEKMEDTLFNDKK